MTLHSPSEFPASSRSSFTFFEPPSPPAHDLEKLHSGSARIDAIASPAEESLEHYGGDDIHEPPPKTKEAFSGGISAGPTLDANMVTWDGPDDPENPQNWSIRRKWFITILTIVMTVNVYVDPNIMPRSRLIVSSGRSHRQHHRQLLKSWQWSSTFQLK